MKRKRISSIKINAFLSMTNTFLTMSFSLITFPYASRVLGATNIGKVNYANSIASYFVMIAALGINTYAIREGGKYRNKRESFNKFASEIYSINMLSVMGAYLLMTIVIVLSKPIREYSILIYLQSIAMINTWISVNWVNIVFEDYLFITIRSLLIQVLSLLFLFTFVKTENDFLIYAGISVVPNSIVAIINHLHAKQYCNIKIVHKIDIKKHLPPIIVLFSNNIAVSIYLNSDTTMIGWILGDYYVGVYTAAVKIYTAIKNLIASVYNVSVTRMSEYYNCGNYSKFSSLLNKMIKMIITIALPATIGAILVSKELIILLSGQEYVLASRALQILSFAFFVAILGGMLAYCVALPMKKEKTILLATLISAIENIVLNIFLIPILGINGAAMTTFFAETTVFILLFLSIKQIWHMFEFKLIFKILFKSAVGSFLFIPLKFLIDFLVNNDIVGLIIYCLLCVLIYVITEYMLNNACVKELIDVFKRKLLCGAEKKKNTRM